MSVRPFRDIKRRKTKVINVGDVKIGGNNPISVQSMTNTLTTNIKGTIEQINDISEEGADIALTFRNVHNWMSRGLEQEFFNAFYKNLKPGGILGVVEHRAPDSADKQKMIDTGYVSEAYVKQIADSAGFEFISSSEINANEKDTKDHPEGVWTLPPSFRMGEVDRSKFAAIGESDRMTLKFGKPE